MQPPRIKTVQTLPAFQLLVSFVDGTVRHYDMRPLLQRSEFAPLSNPSLFRCASVEPGGYAIHWGPDIDVSEYEIWKNGVATQDYQQKRDPKAFGA